MTIELATELCIRAHAGQTRRDGKPYHTHPMTVASMVNDDHKPAALLHDVFEDCPGWTLRYSNSYPVITEPDGTNHPITFTLYGVLQQLTHYKKDEDYDTYIAYIANNYDYDYYMNALPVKIADLLHNISDNATDANKEKYMKTLEVLLAKL